MCIYYTVAVVLFCLAVVCLACEQALRAKKNEEKARRACSQAIVCLFIDISASDVKDGIFIRHVTNEEQTRE